MLDIFSKTFRAATLSSPDQGRPTDQNDDTNRRYPWREHGFGNRRNTRAAQRRMRGMSQHMLNDIGITRDDIDRMFD